MSAWTLDGRWPAIPLAVALAAGVAYLSALSPLAAFVALGVVLLVTVVLTRPEWVLSLMLLALPWEGMLGYPSDTVTVVKLLGLVLLVAVTLMMVGGRMNLYAPVTVAIVVAFVLLVAVSLILSPDPAAGTSKLLRYVLFAGFFFLVIQLIDDRSRLLSGFRVLTVSVAGAAVWGLVLFLGGEEGRAGGPISDPNGFAYLTATVLPLAAYLIVEDKEWRWLWSACFPVILAATLASLSRGAIVALVALLIWAVVTRRIKLGGLIASTFALLASVALVLVLWGPLIDERVEQKGRVATENAESRQALWDGALLMAMDNPVAGVGPGRYGTESVDYVRDNPIALPNPVVHSAYLEILAESGPFALAAFVAFLANAWLATLRQRRVGEATGDRQGARLASAVQASLLIAIVGAFFLSQQLASPFWLIGAFAVALPRVVEGATDAAP